MNEVRGTETSFSTVRAAGDAEQYLSAAVDLVCTVGATHIRHFDAADEWWHDLIPHLGATVPQYQGEVVRHVRPDPAMEAYAVSANNTKELAPHTENFEFDGRPPRYVALYCRIAAGQGGATLLYDSDELLEHLGPATAAALEDALFEWRSPASLASEGIQVGAQHPPVEPTESRPIVRFSAREMYPGARADSRTLELLDRYRSVGITRFAERCTPVRLAAGDLLVWDNWRMIHSRNAFSGARHLERVMFG